MQNLSKLPLILCLCFLSRCDSDKVEISEANGTWLFSSAECDKSEIDMSDISLELEMDDGTGTQVALENDCEFTTEFTYGFSDGEISSAAISNVCDNSPCDVIESSNGVEFTPTCEGDDTTGGGVFTQGQADIEFGTGTMTLTIEHINNDGDEESCRFVFVKQ